MTGLNHALTGAAIGMAVQQPLLIVPAAIVSHFILDAIPHFDHELYRYGSKYYNRIMLIDGVLTASAILLLMLLVPVLAIPIALGAFCAVLPDVPWQYYYTHSRPQHWYFRFHTWIQWFERPPGILVEASYLMLIMVTVIALL